MTSNRLCLSRDAYDSVLEHAREGAATTPPREVCGVLVGERDDADCVTDARRVPNVASDPRTRYELDPEETLAVVDAVESEGRDVVGFYHSHPESPAVPSDTDRAQATWTGYVYAIVSPADDAVRAWRWTGESFAPLDVRTG